MNQFSVIHTFKVFDYLCYILRRLFILDEFVLTIPRSNTTLWVSTNQIYCVIIQGKLVFTTLVVAVDLLAIINY